MASQGTTDRATAIETILERMSRLPSDGDREFAEIEQRYPDLMPELGERLRTLEAIREAARKARPPSSQAPGYSSDAEDSELSYLREEFQGYEIIERLRSGGQGLVCKAVHKATNRIVAVKLLLDGPVAGERQRNRFAREIQLTARLNHPNIVTLYDSGVVRGRLYYAMEFVEGLPIDDYALLHDLSPGERISLFVTICRAVDHAHAQGIIHRDLKPSNILVDNDGRPHILDFGLAKECIDEDDSGQASRMTATGQMVGTLPYLSPEQAGGDDEIDVRSDLYSLGVILFELLTGMFPYPVEGKPLAVRTIILTREPLSLRKAISAGHPAGGLQPEDVTDDLEAIVRKSLEKEKTRRYLTAGAFADDLERSSRGEAVEAKRDRALYLLQKSLRKYRVHMGIATAFVIILIAGLVGTLLMWQRAEHVAHIAQTGLQMGSFVKLGSVDRDEDRIPQAVAMFEKAIEIGGTVSTTDRYVRRQQYEAHHGLAELYVGLAERGQPVDRDKARGHGEAAIQIAENMIKDDPDGLEWRRLSGFSLILGGRLALIDQEWQSALERLDRAAWLFENLLARGVDNVSVKSDLAFVHGLQGQCCRKLERFDDSLRYYTAAYDVNAELARLRPEVLDYQLDLSQSELKLAVWHMTLRTPEDDCLALNWLDSAGIRLTSVNASGRVATRKHDVERLLADITSNRNIISNRAIPDTTP